MHISLNVCKISSESQSSYNTILLAGMILIELLEMLMFTNPQSSGNAVIIGCKGSPIPKVQERQHIFDSLALTPQPVK